MPVPIDVQATGARGVWLAGSLSFAAIVIAVAFVVIVPERLITVADTTFSEGDYESSLIEFERAAYWYPDDPYIEWSLSWAHYMLDDNQRAEHHMSRAVDFDPENPYYVLDHGAVLCDLNRLAEAAAAAERAEQLNHPEPERIEHLRALIRLSAASASGDVDSTP